VYSLLREVEKKKKDKKRKSVGYLVKGKKGSGMSAHVGGPGLVSDKPSTQDGPNV